jgi:hypothetical protein
MVERYVMVEESGPFLSFNIVTVMAVPTVISERDSAGRTRRIFFGKNDMKVCPQMGKVMHKR